MISIVRFFLCSFLAVGFARAATTETLPGQLEHSPDQSLILTLALPVAKFAELADKAGKEAEFDLPALSDLIRERFHYLLRLRVGEQDFAPTRVQLPVPSVGNSVPETLPLTVTWTHVPNEAARVVTQTDVPYYRVELKIDDRREPPRSLTPKTTTAAARSAISLWVREASEGAKRGFTQSLSSGMVQLLFVLALYFSAQTGRELMARLGVFSGTHAAALGLGLSGHFQIPSFAAQWCELAVGISLVALAVVNCLGRRGPSRKALAWFAAAGGLLGFGMLTVISEGRAFTGGNIWSIAALVFGVQVTLWSIAIAAALFSSLWRQDSWHSPEIAVPASVVIGIGGLAWMLECVPGAFSF